MAKKIVPIYVCQKCGDETDGGDANSHGRHEYNEDGDYCGGQLDPNGDIEIDDDEESIVEVELDGEDEPNE